MRFAPHFRLTSVMILIVCSVSCSGQRQLFREYGSSDGLSNLNVKCLFQDHTGYLWVGTDNGLFRYDGSTFRGFGHADGLPNTEILSLSETPAGVLWVGTNSGLAQASDDHFVPVSLGREAAIHSIGFDSMGDVYIEQEDGILRGIPNNRGSYSFQSIVTGSISGLFVSGDHISFGKDGSLWEVKGSDAKPMGRSSGLPSDQWDSIVDDSLGNRWVRSKTRLYELPRGQSHFTDRSNGIARAAEAHLYVDRHGSVFVSTTSGIVVLAGNQRTAIDVRHGLPADPSGPMLIDREESLWIGTDGGGLVRRLGHGEWAAWKKEDGLLRSSVWAIQRDRSGNVWVGTNGGLNLINSSGSVARVWTNHNGLPGDRVLSITVAPDGEVYAGTDSGAIGKFSRHGALLHIYSTESGYLAERVSSMAIDHSGRLWAAGTGGCFRTKAPLLNGAPRFERMEIPGIPSKAFFRDILVDEHGMVWVASSQGLARYDEKRWKIFTMHDGLESKDLGVITEAEGSIWIAYRDAIGMTRLQGPNLSPIHITTQDGLHSNQIYAIQSDHKGQLWVSTDAGVDVLRNGRWKHYGNEDGLIWNDTDSLALSIDSEDNVWIGTSAGLSRFAQPEFPIREQSPPIVLTSITGTSQKWMVTENPVLPYSQRSLSIQYAALSYESALTMRYRYRLAGLDDKWTETSERSVRFAALPPGHYVFEITVAGANGLWNHSPARFVFSIRSPWWLSWWFIGSSVLVIFLAGSAFVKLRIHALERQKKGLEQQVADRTAELVTSHRQLEEIAYYDVLTNTPNRRMFIEQFRKHLLSAEVSTTFTLLLIDLDFFKNINDSFGHDAGDAVLVETARRLKAEVRQSDCVARLGGDEFAVLLLSQLDIPATEAICQRLLKNLAVPIHYKHKKLQVGCSIGIAKYPFDGKSQESLYKSADMALYESKQRGRSVFCWHKPQEQHTVATSTLEHDLHRYLTLDEIQVEFQPIYSVSPRQIVGFEALARWSDTERGDISPNVFIPIAENSGLIQKLSAKVLTTACRQTASWNQLWSTDLFVSVNISIRQFSDPSLIPQIMQALTTSGLDPKHLHLEITESILLLDDMSVERTLVEARSHGIGVSLDDFGTGYSSLSYLLNLSVDELKIDQSFIQGIELDQRKVELVRTVLTLGRTLGKRVISEGVETEEQLEILRDLGCEYVQGYLLSRPLTKAAVETMMSKQFLVKVPHSTAPAPIAADSLSPVPKFLM